MQAWQQNILESGLVEKTVSEDFDTLFSNFYLTNTYLAEGKDSQAQGGCGSTSCCG
ncbi:glutathione S-transferase [Vibrio maritimus]|uniref:Glutathione S-transferase n=1 Tax=Vibrio maritimus TaxID=990268 RepID=A0A090TE58_9VIBR|nr:glutathione S-transferase [Vibrio maritimus]